MLPLTYYHVDVFAERPLAGNQLAVFRNAAHLTTDTMQALAREMNFSESTFLLSEDVRNGAFPVRIFTPAEEVPFAGHPTLGTAFIIRKYLLPEPAPQVVLDLKVGQIPVDFQTDDSGKELAWMKQIEPEFGTVHLLADFARMLNLPDEDVDDRFPVQEVSTGIPFFVVPLRTLAAVKRASLNREFYFSYIQRTKARAMLLFCPEAEETGNHLHARMFADALGVPEDPATGSANGCLAAYLAKYRYFDSPEISVRVEQGYEIQRPSLLHLRACDQDGHIDVRVGGEVHLVARGEVFL